MTMRICGSCGELYNTDNIDYKGKCPKCGKK